MAEIDIEKTQVAPDFEKLRDEKCIPAAREIFAAMAETLLPEDANVKVDYNPILTTIMRKTLDTDMNIALETTYMFQLILGILSGLNKTVQTCDTTLIDEARYSAIGRKILKIVSDAQVSVGPVTPEQTTTDFAPVKEKLNELFTEEKLSLLEIKYVMDQIFDSFKTVQQLYDKNIEQSVERAESKLFGIDTMADLSVGKLNTVLITDISKAEAPIDTQAEPTV